MIHDPIPPSPISVDSNQEDVTIFCSSPLFKEVSDLPFAADTIDDWLVCRGDMLGDKLLVRDRHISIVEGLLEETKFYWQSPSHAATCYKTVVAVGGASGSGKSEVASVLASILTHRGWNSYVLSLDNYPRRPPRENERHRETLFEEAGETELALYLGTDTEIDFSRVSTLVREFKSGSPTLSLRIMDNTSNQVSSNSKIEDFRNISVLVIEGTWSSLISNVDLRVFLQTDFERTLEHRRARARDPLTEFGERVLRIEQGKLEGDSFRRADLVAAEDGRIVESVFARTPTRMRRKWGSFGDLDDLGQGDQERELYGKLCRSPSWN